MPVLHFTNQSMLADQNTLSCAIILPFGGFYQSLHEHALNHVIEDELNTFETMTQADRDAIIALDADSFDADTWSALELEIAKDYSQWVLAELAKFTQNSGLTLLKDPAFVGDLISPKEYNFVNDQIILHLPSGYLPSIATLERHYPGIMSLIEALANEQLASREGFVGDHNPNILDVQDIHSDNYLNEAYAGVVMGALVLKAFGYNNLDELDASFHVACVSNNTYNAWYYSFAKNSDAIQSIINNYLDD